MVFIALPSDVEDEVEDWFSNHLNDMTRKGSANFMKALPQVSKEIHELIAKKKASGNEENSKSNVYLKLSVPKRPITSSNVHVVFTRSYYECC